jgi:hypothetical protein
MNRILIINIRYSLYSKIILNTTLNLVHPSSNRKNIKVQMDKNI